MKDKTQIMRALGLGPDGNTLPQKMKARLGENFTDLDVLLRISWLSAFRPTARDINRVYGKSGNVKNYSKVKLAISRLAMDGFVDFENKTKIGRPAVYWFLTEAGKELLATQAAEE